MFCDKTKTQKTQKVKLMEQGHRRHNKHQGTLVYFAAVTPLTLTPRLCALHPVGLHLYVFAFP